VARVEINIIVWKWFIETRNVSRTQTSKRVTVVLTLETRVIVDQVPFRKSLHNLKCITYVGIRPTTQVTGIIFFIYFSSVCVCLCTVKTAY
jgi:hypothetical protein